MTQRSRPDANEQGVVLGLSGGIDSATAAVLLRNSGRRVVGVTLRTWQDPGEPGGDARVAVSLDRAEGVARRLGIEHVVVDVGELFRERVVEYFLAEYAAGRTPNPCVKCNARLKLVILEEIADERGLSHIATGHYARLSGEPPGLSRGVDPRKDQSYVLAEVPPFTLRRCLFPLGGMTKDQVRSVAAQAGLVPEAADESQEICFIPDNDYRSFLRSRLGDLPGRIVDETGVEVGPHAGTYNYTIGQRRGLGIAGAEPRQVIAIDASRREVTVGRAGATAVGVVRIQDVVEHRAPSGRQGDLQIRSAGEAVRARPAGGDTFVLDRPAFAVACGQTAVYYEGANVVRAGTITATEPWESDRAYSTEKGVR